MPLVQEAKIKVYLYQSIITNEKLSLFDVTVRHEVPCRFHLGVKENIMFINNFLGYSFARLPKKGRDRGCRKRKLLSEHKNVRLPGSSASLCPSSKCTKAFTDQAAMWLFEWR